MRHTSSGKFHSGILHSCSSGSSVFQPDIWCSNGKGRDTVLLPSKKRILKFRVLLNYMSNFYPYSFSPWLFVARHARTYYSCLQMSNIINENQVMILVIHPVGQHSEAVVEWPLQSPSVLHLQVLKKQVKRLDFANNFITNWLLSFFDNSRASLWKVGN